MLIQIRNLLTKDSVTIFKTEKTLDAVHVFFGHYYKDTESTNDAKGQIKAAGCRGAVDTRHCQICIAVAFLPTQVFY